MFDNVTGFKLTNGHEIIAKISVESETGYTIEDALHIFAEPSAENLAVRFVPLTFFCKNKPGSKENLFAVDFTLPKSQVLFKYTPRDDVQKAYYGTISTIVLPN
jgi:hypothetical protein